MSEIEECGGKPYYIYGNKFGVGNEGTAASAYAMRMRRFRRMKRSAARNLTISFARPVPVRLRQD